MSGIKISYRLSQWILISAMTLCTVIMAGVGVYALRTTQTLLYEGNLISIPADVEIVQVGGLKLKDSDLWKLPAFSATRDEYEWWNTQQSLYKQISGSQSVIVAFFDSTAPEPEERYELSVDVGAMPTQEVISRLGLIFIVAAIYIFASIIVQLNHENTEGFICAIFFSSTALYLVSLGAVAHRHVILDPELMKLLVDVFFVASTGQIAIVHFALIFPEKKKFVSRHPSLTAGFYLYSAIISALYLSGYISLTTTVPFLLLWIVLMSFAFLHSMIYLEDRFMRKQIRAPFIALLLVAIFVFLVIYPSGSWPVRLLPIGGWLVNNQVLFSLNLPLNNYALFSLILPFALMLSLDTRKFYQEQLQLEYNSHQEKARIHRELHDTVLNDLASISIATEGAERNLDNPEKLREKLRAIKNNTAESSRQLRSFLWVIDERQNNWEEIANSLRRLGYDLLNNFDISFEMLAHGILDGTPPPPLALKHTIHQTFREALINVTKHARASRVRSTLTVDPSGVSISITDDGVGLPDKAEHKGYGIYNMIRRIKESNGEIRIESASGGGTSITIQLPLN